MRLIKVSAPQGNGAKIAQTAFAAGIKEVSIYQAEIFSANSARAIHDVVDTQVSTPVAKKFLDALLAEDYFDSETFSINVRQPRSIISKENSSILTVPFVEPAADILEELWQFSHITLSFVGRFFIAACLLALGLIQQNTLLIIAGLLFLPILPVLLSISFGILTKQWRLAGQSALALLAAITLLFLGGVAVAFLSNPPIKYDSFSSLGVAFLISLGVGIAAVLANTDDVGRREMIGLAATAQIAIIPVWFGICAGFGFPATATRDEIVSRALAFGLNLLTIVVTTLVVYAFLGIKSNVFDKLQTGEK